MSIYRIIVSIIKYYFNVNRKKFSYFFLNSTFLRRFEFSLKIVISFIISGLIAYGSPLRHYLDQQYLICVISVLSTQETFGFTFYSSIQTALSLIPLSILLFLIQLIGLSYKHYLAAELLLLFLSLIIAYQCTQIQTRKITLLYNAVFFSTIVNQEGLPKFFVFVLLILFLIGMTISIVVSLIIFPLFATIDIENRFSYCLKNFQRMYYFLIQAYLSREKINSKLSLSRANILHQMIRQTMNIIQTRINETQYEPSIFLQKLFFRKRKSLLNLTIQEESNLLNTLMLHIGSIELLVNQCEYNNYHHYFVNEMETSIYYLNSCQSSLISSFISRQTITKDQFLYRLLNLSKSLQTVRLAFKNLHFDQIENSIKSDDHLSHSAFIFQLISIVKLLNQITIKTTKNANIQKPKTKIPFPNLFQCLTFDWSRLFLSLKSVVIIGVGSIFVMVPYLSRIFENGQWILIALCMTQADTVGGAFTTMKMRLIGTLLGAMWAYITYLLVHNHLFATFLLIIPWIFLFAYLRLFPKWGYMAAVASFTPILVNLGRLPYGDKLPAGDYALLRIEENLVGIILAIILTMTIFPVYAIDLLKENIQKSLECCCESVNSMHEVYDELFGHKHFEKDFSIYFDNKNEMKSFLDKQRSSFYQLINYQKLLVSNASIEPTFFWFKNDFPSFRYDLIVQQQIEIFRMLNNIDATLIELSECSIKNENQLEIIKSCSSNGLYLPNVHNELFDLSQQLNNSFTIWSNYFQLTQTRCYKISRGLIPKNTNIIQTDLLIHEKSLIQLNQRISRLQSQHEHGIKQLFNNYFKQIDFDQKSLTFLHRVQTEQHDLILIALSSMYFYITQLALQTLDLGTTIHQVLELETTDLYQPF